MTQQQKRDQMKLKGPVRKAPPIAETRKKLCSKVPRNVQKELHQLLEEFSGLFLEQLPKGKPPKREVEFEIKLEEGAVPLNKPPYRLSPKEHDKLQAQIDCRILQVRAEACRLSFCSPRLVGSQSRSLEMSLSHLLVDASVRSEWLGVSTNS